MTRRYDLEEVELDYRKLTAQGEKAAAIRIKSFLNGVRYDLRMDSEVILEYRQGFDEPMVMRILRTEEDLDRFVQQRFNRLDEF
jgi:hypothetical protein